MGVRNQSHLAGLAEFSPKHKPRGGSQSLAIAFVNLIAENLQIAEGRGQAKFSFGKLHHPRDSRAAADKNYARRQKLGAIDFLELFFSDFIRQSVPVL